MGEPILVTHNILINHMGTASVVLFLYLGNFMNIDQLPGENAMTTNRDRAAEAKVSTNQARILMSVIDPHRPPIRKDWDDHLVYRLAATVDHQAAQIERLQRALRGMLADYIEIDHSHWSEFHIGRSPYSPPKLDDYGLTEGDMEDTDD